MQRRGREKKKGGGGVKVISDWLEGGGLNFFIKKFRGGQQFDYEIMRYILRGVHWPRWVKQFNKINHVKQ